MQRHSPQELARLADLHTCAVQAWLSSRAPAAACLDRIGVRATSTGLPIPLLNLALSKGYPPGTADEDIGKEIESVKAFFAVRNVPWYWWLAPHLSPPHMVQLLQAHGLAFDRPPLPAMIAHLPSPAIPLPPDIQVWQATTLTDLQVASQIRHTAFRFPAGVGLDYFQSMAADWLKGDPARLFLASFDSSPPAAIGALIMGNGLPGIYVMATLPEWSRRGLGKAILTRLLDKAALEGHNLVALTASRLGYPLYQQFGFEHVFDYAIYRPDDGR